LQLSGQGDHPLVDLGLVPVSSHTHLSGPPLERASQTLKAHAISSPRLVRR
jgi:hypothetical protein